MTPTMIGIFLEPDSLTETLDLATWGTQLNAFMMFILAWSAILGGALRGSWGHLRSDDDFCSFLVVSILACLGADSDF